MRILFHLLQPGYLRNYDSTVRLLAERGHEIHVVYPRPPAGSGPTLAELLAAEVDGVSARVAPKRPRQDPWRGIAWSLRALTDASRFLDPRYEQAPLLRARPLQRLDKRIGSVHGTLLGHTGERLLERLRGPADAALSARLVRIFTGLEWGIPPSPEITSFIGSAAPDAVLVSPLVNVASDQVDYVKSAQALGIPVGVCVASWDNLTNKGLIRVNPERVFLWNDVQRREAIELHGIEPDRITVTGAQRFDDWFEQKPSRSAADFANRAGLNPSHPFLLYVCSSRFIARNEVPFVRRWIEALRRSDNASLRALGVLVRPHPQNAAQWRVRPLAEFENVSVWPEEGKDPVDAGTRADFFDSIAHSEAVVGINTSSLIEAAIIGKSVFTVRAREFRGTQEGTLHFQYLLHEHGGFLHVAETLGEHLEQLGTTLEDPDLHREQTLRFVAAFVRPHGLDRPATPALADGIEQLSSTVTGRGAPWWARVARAALRLAAAGAKIRIPGRSIVRPRRARRALAGARRRIVRLGIGFADSRSSAPLRALARRHPPLHMALRRLLLGLAAPTDTSSHETHTSHMKRRFRRSLREKETLVLGPWIGDEATELLYWIPFLRWGLSRHGVDPAGVVAASVNDVGEWYADLASTFVRVQAHVELEGALARAASVRPLVLERFSQSFRAGRGSIREILKHAHYLGPSYDSDEGGSGSITDLEPTASFRPDPVVSDALESALKTLSPSRGASMGHDPTRTAGIASAERVVAGFGRISHAGILAGVPTTAIYTEPDVDRPSLALAQRVARRLGTPFTALSVRELAALAELRMASAPREPFRDR